MDTVETEGLGIDEQALIAGMDNALRYVLGRRPDEISRKDVRRALAMTLRRPVIDIMQRTEDRQEQAATKQAFYLSIEYLLGRTLDNAIINLGLTDACRAAAQAFGYELEQLYDDETDPSLGNGGLGRLAACFLDSLATLNMPGHGYGINYEFGLFRQAIQNGLQIEMPDRWMHADSPWLIRRSDQAVPVLLYGRVDYRADHAGNKRPYWVDCRWLMGVPYDMPVVGYGGRTVNRLRLFEAKAQDDFDMAIFNAGDYVAAVQSRINFETVSKVLYPEDATEAGKELRLIQEYFLVSCALQDILRRHWKQYGTVSNLAEKTAIQLNDTHPALTVAELMRALLDVHSLNWDEAWEITQATLAYTNHTLLPEALEKWSVDLMGRVIPRHLQIIYEINHRFMQDLQGRFPNRHDLLSRTSLIEEGMPKQVRMANLAMLGSHSVNGVAKLHSELQQRTFGADYYELFPERFNNKTNGITQRRWLLKANPKLAALITDSIGKGWITDLERLRELEPLAGDKAFQQAFIAAKRSNKEKLIGLVKTRCGVEMDPDSLFDVQAKRIHEYKRQLLNALSLIDAYLRVVDDGEDVAPRSWLFAGKSAPGYYMAKLIIKLINDVAETVNTDPKVGGRLRAAFVPDYKVSLAEVLIPAANLSEQISTAGFEASGTGNMKFALNGAMTLGTLDGANIEIRDAVGAENFYLFGLTAQEVETKKREGYDPWTMYRSDPRIKRIIDTIWSGRFCRGHAGMFSPIADALTHGGDRYLCLADFEDYIAQKGQAVADYYGGSEWTRRAIMNVARIGYFSSDRTIREYAADIWKIAPQAG
ncbi:MAG: glycogen/starch/alpha-glucan phosphorylase [Rhodospirillaceae bacterium]|nr:glycogen/starch/alpha-glucan phosphorylase [Rhodospirillaceae bacterium]